METISQNQQPPSPATKLSPVHVIGGMLIASFMAVVAVTAYDKLSGNNHLSLEKVPPNPQAHGFRL